MAQLLPNVKQQFLDANGLPLAGGQLFSYAAGTATPLATFTDNSEATPNANPTILDANGVASIWIGSASYKFVLKDSLNNTLWTVDNVIWTPNNSVTTQKIVDAAVTTQKLADNSVSTAKIIDAAVTTNKYADLSITTAKMADGAVTNAKAGYGFVPAGAILPFGGSAAPTGFLLCDGTSYLRASYAALFAAISTAYGTADATHFNVPDLRGQFLRGVTGAAATDPDTTSRTAMATGGATGNNVGSVQTDQIRIHAHGVALGTANLNGANVLGTNNAGGAFTGSTVSYGASETRPTNAYVNYIIKY